MDVCFVESIAIDPESEVLGEPMLTLPNPRAVGVGKWGGVVEWWEREWGEFDRGGREGGEATCAGRRMVNTREDDE